MIDVKNRWNKVVEKPFHKIKVGEVFVLLGHLYIKTPTATADAGYVVNAIALASKNRFAEEAGKYLCICENDRCYPVNALMLCNIAKKEEEN